MTGNYKENRIDIIVALTIAASLMSRKKESLYSMTACTCMHCTTHGLFCMRVKIVTNYNIFQERKGEGENLPHTLKCKI